MNLTISSRDGLDLEGSVDAPDDPVAVVVVCHPHPKLGGTMNAPLLQALAEAFVARGWIVVRFNFRGIGRSQGEPSLGESEVADAEGAIDWARREFPGLPVALVGWSFGGAVALRTAARDPSLAACVAIAPSVVAKPEITAGLPPPTELEFALPLLFICGANDKQVDPAAVRSWAQQAGARYEEMPGANHFFWAKYDDLGRLTTEFVATELSQPKGAA